MTIKTDIKGNKNTRCCRDCSTNTFVSEWVSESSFSSKSSKYHKSRTVRAGELEFWGNVHHPQHITCHISHVTCCILDPEKIENMSKQEIAHMNAKLACKIALRNKTEKEKVVPKKKQTKSKKSRK